MQYHKKDPKYQITAGSLEKFDALLLQIGKHLPVKTALGVIGMSRITLDKIINNDAKRRGKYYKARAKNEATLCTRIVEMANNEKRPDPKPLQWLLSKTNPAAYGKFRDEHIPVTMSEEVRNSIREADNPCDKIKVIAEAVLDGELDLIVAERFSSLLRKAHPEISVDGGFDFKSLLDVPDNGRSKKE